MSSTALIEDFRLSAGGVLIDEKRKKVCLIKKISSGEYLLPKGSKEKEETILEAAEREVFEETGYENKIISGKPLGLYFRPHVGGRPGEQKVIYWYYSELKNEECKEGTQEEYENFSNEWLTLEDALKSLKFEDDKVLVERAFRYLSGKGTLIDEHAEKVTEFKWCGPEEKCIRLLTSPSSKIVQGFAAIDKLHKRILLAEDRISHSWNLPTEKNVKTAEVLQSKLEGASPPFLYQVILNTDGLTVRQWYLLETIEEDVEDAQWFDKDEALSKLKQNSDFVSIASSAFSKAKVFKEKGERINE